MDQLMGIDTYIYQILLIDLVIAVAMIAGLRFVTGVVANVNSAEELAARDNVAFGIAMAAGIISLALMLTGAVSGEPGMTYANEIASVLAYGILGVLLIKIGRLVQDKIVLRGIEIQAQIKRGNVAAALVDAANTLAIGLILRAVMLWVESDTFSGLLVVLIAFVDAQILLALVAYYRAAVYARRHDGTSLQAAFANGQTALALWALQGSLATLWTPVFFGLKKMGTAFFIMACLWVTVFSMMIFFSLVETFLGMLLIPYLLWVSYAAALNYTVWKMNPNETPRDLTG